MVEDALSYNLVGPSDGISPMRLSVDSPLLGLIREAQVEGVREEK